MKEFEKSIFNRKSDEQIIKEMVLEKMNFVEDIKPIDEFIENNKNLDMLKNIRKVCGNNIEIGWTKDNYLGFKGFIIFKDKEISMLIPYNICKGEN